MSEIPSWLHQVAPGAAAALSSISSPRKPLFEPNRERLKRLINDDAEEVWRDTGTKSDKWKWDLSEDELYIAQYILAAKTYKAPDIPPIGHLEAERVKVWLTTVGTDATELANKIRKALAYDLIIDMYWQHYRAARPDDKFFQGLPDSLSEIARAFDYIGDFFDHAATIHRPEGPRLTVVQQPDSERALKRAVIHRIGNICRSYFRQPMYSVVARLANLTLGCDDITDKLVREVLRNPWGVG